MARASVLEQNSSSFGNFNSPTYDKDMAFSSGRWQDLIARGHLTSLAVADAVVDAGISLLANHEYVSSWT